MSGRRVPTDLGEPPSQSSAIEPKGVKGAGRRGDTGGRRVPTEIGEAHAGDGRSVPTERGDTQPGGGGRRVPTEMGDMHAGGLREPTEQGEAGAELQPRRADPEAASKTARDSKVRELNGRGGCRRGQ